MKALIFLIPLAACAGQTPEPRIVVQDTLVPVAVSCIPKSYDPKRPDYPDSDKALAEAEDAAVRYQLLWAGRGARAARENENEAVISGCLEE